MVLAGFVPRAPQKQCFGDSLKLALYSGGKSVARRSARS